MKYKESYPGIKSDVLDLLKKLIPDTFASNLRDGGVNFDLPEDRDLELKVKYSDEVEKGSVLLEIGWSKLDAEEEEEEKEEERGGEEEEEEEEEEEDEDRGSEDED